MILTGAASFTGSWFALALLERAFEPVCVLQRRLDDYPPLERARLARLRNRVEIIECCGTGTKRFADLCGSEGGFDLLCMHGARSGNNRDVAFDALAALEANLAGMPAALDALAKRALGGLLYTGSVFEADEGVGSEPRNAIGAYGLSKTLTYEAVRFMAAERGIPFGKFVIAHPFGAFDKQGLARSLIGAWLHHETPLIRQPDLVRDAVPVDRLASCYAAFARDLALGQAPAALRPSGFIEPTSQFAARLAANLRPLLGCSCAFASASKVEPCPEPRVRINTDPIDRLVPLWDEEAFWRDLAAETRGAAFA